MANDIVPDLLEKIEEDFMEAVSSNKKVAALYAKIELDKADYDEMNELAILIGEAMANAFRKNVSSATLPDGRMYYNIAERIISSSMRMDYDTVAAAAVRVQESLNQKAGLHMKAVRPAMNEDRVRGLVDAASNAEQYDQVAGVVEESLVNHSQSVVTDFVRENAGFQYKAGMDPKIVRRAQSGCCDWCSQLAGTYLYGDVSHSGAEVFRRHRGCRCSVMYDPADGSKKRQNVHTKEWHDDAEPAKIEERKKIQYPASDQTPGERMVKANMRLSIATGGGEHTQRIELGKINPDRTEEPISFMGDQIRAEPVENAFVVDKSGRVFHFIGDERGVEIFDVDLDGASVTHNHPVSQGIVSFGEDDFVFLRENPNTILYCVNPEYNYLVTANDKIKNSYYNQGLVGALAFVDRNNAEDQQHLIMEWFRLGGYVNYERRKK